MAKIDVKVSGDLEKRLEEAFVNGKIAFNPRQLSKWKKIYGIVGNHSAIEICLWTKKAIRGEDVCYKQKFYGIDAHRCAQISPAAAWCQEACIFCWRPMEWYSRTYMKEEEVDGPSLIVEESVRVRKKLLTGFGGNPKANKTLFKQAYEKFPTHWAISLSGEPTIYPKLAELILELRKHKEVRSIFVVSNGQEPDALLKLQEKDALPTQLYISVDAPNKEVFDRVNRSVYKDGWERLMRTLFEVLPKLKCRRVIRFTAIKGINDLDEYLPLYGEIFERSKVDYVEIKSYMWLGQSRKRLSKSHMLTHEEIRELAKKMLKYMPNYFWNNEDKASRIVLLKRKDSPYNDIIPLNKGARAEVSLKA